MAIALEKRPSSLRFSMAELGTRTYGGTHIFSSLSHPPDLDPSGRKRIAINRSGYWGADGRLAKSHKIRCFFLADG